VRPKNQPFTDEDMAAAMFTDEDFAAMVWSDQ
jgi:hypothetical protein